MLPTVHVSIHSYTVDPRPVWIKWESDGYNRQETALGTDRETLLITKGKPW